MTGHIAVTAIGPDRPGIVAAITRVLFELGCNLQDVTSTILQGHFTMVLVVSPPTGVAAPDIERRLSRVATELDLVVTARPVGDADTKRETATHMVSVYGADHPGIVYEVSELLAGRGVNILDLNSRVVGSDPGEIYVLMLEVAIADASGIDVELDRLGERIGVDVSIHSLETDIF